MRPYTSLSACSPRTGAAIRVRLQDSSPLPLGDELASLHPRVIATGVGTSCALGGSGGWSLAYVSPRAPRTVLAREDDSDSSQCVEQSNEEKKIGLAGQVQLSSETESRAYVTDAHVSEFGQPA